jgi:O-antigen/teichoic acid export membrane protein
VPLAADSRQAAKEMHHLHRLIALLSSNSPSLLALGRLLTSALALLSAPIVAQAIGPTGRGETAAAIAAINLLPVFLAVGVPAEVRRLAAIGQGRAAIGTSRRLALFAGAPLSIVAAFLLWGSLFSTLDPASRIIATVGIALAPLLISWQSDVGVLVAMNRFRHLFLLVVSQQTLYVAIVGALWVTNQASTATVIAANLVGIVGTFFVGFSLVRPKRLGPRSPRITSRSMFRGSIRYAGAAIAESASYRLDQVLALPIIGAYGTGLYAVATTIASVPLSFGHAVAAHYYPLVARADEADRRLLNAEAARVGFATAILIAVPLGAVTPFAIPLLFGTQFVSAVVPAMLSLAGAIMLTGGYVASSLLASTGRGIVMTIAQSVSLGVGIALLFFLGPWLGATGASLASTISYLVLAVIAVGALGVLPLAAFPRPRDFSRSVRVLFKSR